MLEITAGTRIRFKGLPRAFGVWCPPGQFWMGTVPDDPEADEDELPQHLVEIKQGFWLAETPVTQAQWVEYMPSNPSTFQSPTRPVEQITWYDAVYFCNRLSEAAGLTPAYLLDQMKGKPGQKLSFRSQRQQDANGYRLPTEQEWEYACRAGSRDFRYGPLLDIAWTYDNADARTHPVKKKLPNDWGLYDILGNVCEWVDDWSGDYPSAPPQQRVGAKKTAQHRAFRSGSWDDAEAWNRAAYRGKSHPNQQNSYLGFRLLCPS